MKNKCLALVLLITLLCACGKNDEVLNYSHGQYIGEVSNGKANGQGTYTSKKSGTIYKGRFYYDTFSGDGTMTWRNGDKFTGTWDNDVGTSGTMTYANGANAEGTVRAGRFLASKPNQNNSPSQNYGSNNNQINIGVHLAECAGFYYFAASSGDPNDKDMKLKASEFSLQIANGVSKIPMNDLKKIRNDTMSKLSEKFEQLVSNNDHQELRQWGNSVGAMQNECTQSLQNISDTVLKR